MLLTRESGLAHHAAQPRDPEPERGVIRHPTNREEAAHARSSRASALEDHRILDFGFEISGHACPSRGIQTSGGRAEFIQDDGSRSATHRHGQEQRDVRRDAPALGRDLIHFDARVRRGLLLSGLPEIDDKER